MAEQLTLLVLSGFNTDIAPLHRVDPRVAVVDGRQKLLPEYRRSYPPAWVSRALPPPTEAELRTERDPTAAASAAAEREALLREADLAVSFAMAIFPPDLPRRAPRLRWLHAASAGPDRLKEGQGRALEGSYVITTGRGYVNPLPIAEYILAGVFYFAKSLAQAHGDKERGAFDSRAYRSQSVAGKTMGIVGLGGIGRQVARLAHGVEMEVVATRYSVSRRLEGAATGEEGVDLLLPASDLPELLARSHFVALCAPWTDDTHHLMRDETLALMRPGAFLINAARGELVDEEALQRALRSSRVGGAMLDVYDRELERPPDPELWSLPNVLMTPHVAGRSEGAGQLAMEFYCRQLRRFLSGQPLENVVDQQRGY
ncbi:MAG: D-2-hydroxyacid dehydrogenase [Chloroflexi bacterium]|nr:D-2-hydroxyacid dehydrogenase [Chloroflexota bacterium]